MRGPGRKIEFIQQKKIGLSPLILGKIPFSISRGDRKTGLLLAIPSGVMQPLQWGAGAGLGWPTRELALHFQELCVRVIEYRELQWGHLCHSNPQILQIRAFKMSRACLSAHHRSLTILGVQTCQRSGMGPPDLSVHSNGTSFLQELAGVEHHLQESGTIPPAGNSYNMQPWSSPAPLLVGG